MTSVMGQYPYGQVPVSGSELSYLRGRVTKVKDD